MNDVKNLMDADKLFAGSEMFRIIFSRFERMEKELASLREKCKGVDDLKAKIMDLEEQHRRESAITCKTISGLIDVVSSIKADNMILKQQIETLRGCHDHGLEDVKNSGKPDGLNAEKDQGVEDWDAAEHNQDEAVNVPLEDEPPVRSPGENSETDLPRLESFKPLQLLGSGGFGKVYLVRKIGGVDDGTLYAMKAMDIKEIMSVKDGCDQYRTERGLLQKGLEAPFLVGVYYEFQTKTKLCLVQEYYAGGDLFEVLREWGGVFSVDETRLYLSEIIEAVEYLHKLRVIHRDLKLQNIFVDAEGHIAVADYGLCKDFAWTKKGDRAYSVCGTKQYMAPEMIVGEGYSYEVDWWSVGVMAFEMMIGRTPFQSHEDKSDEALFLNILYRSPDIPASFSNFESDFIRRMLEKDPRVRLGGGKGGVDEMKEHPFFDGINWDDVSRRKLVMPHALDSEWENLVNFEVLLENEVSFLRPGDEGGNISEGIKWDDVSRRHLVMPHALDSEWEDLVDFEVVLENEVSFLRPGDEGGNIIEACSYIAPVPMPNTPI